MKSLVKIGISILLGFFAYSIVMTVWESYSFDNEFIGIVQNAGLKSESAIREIILHLAYDHGIELYDESISTEHVEEDLEFFLEYDVELGLAGLTYTWRKSVSARTTGGAHVGVPQGLEHMPSSRDHNPRYGKSQKSRAKESANKIKQRISGNR